MKTTETMDIRGFLTMELHDRKGAEIRRITAKNSIVLSGHSLIANMFVGIKTDPVSHIAVGTGSDAVDPSDIKLRNEIFRKAINPVDATVDLTITDDNRRKVTVKTELKSAEGNGELTEAALFSVNPADPNPALMNNGVMYNRVVFPKVTKTTDFTLTLIWEIIF